MKRAILTLAAIGLAMSLAGPVVAVGRPGATFVLSDPAPAYGDTLTVTATAIGGSQGYLLLHVLCSQAGDPVYVAGGRAYRSEPVSETVVLVSDSWPGGAAQCEAILSTTRIGDHFKVLDRAAFEVAP